MLQIVPFNDLPAADRRRFARCTQDGVRPATLLADADGYSGLSDTVGKAVFLVVVAAVGVAVAAVWDSGMLNRKAI